MMAIHALIISLALGGTTNPPPLAQMSVGVEGRVLFTHPGPPLRSREDLGPDLVLRIADRLTEGDAGSLYDLRIIARRPGALDLGQFLERVDGSPLEAPPVLPVLVRSILPVDHSGDLTSDARHPPPGMGGYRAAMIVLAVLFLLPPIVVLVRRLSRPRASPAPALADPAHAALLRMRALIDQMIAGDLSAERHAALERALIDDLRNRLAPRGARAVEDLRAIRSDAHAGELISRLEAVLHRRETNDEDWSRARAALDDFLREATSIPSAAEAAP